MSTNSNLRILAAAQELDVKLVAALSPEQARQLPCPICGKGKWKTVAKNRIFQCRVCKYRREI